MPPKKRKKTMNEYDETGDAEDLESLGIFEDDEEREDDRKESWRDVG
jgi:hypothetical protein